MSAGMVIMPPRPSRASSRRPAVTLPVWPSRAPSVTTRAPSRAASAVACGIDRDDQDAGEALGAARRPRAHRSIITSISARRWAGESRGDEPLLGALQLLDRARPPRCRVAAHLQRNRQQSRTVRASRSRSSSVVIRVGATCTLARDALRIAGVDDIAVEQIAVALRRPRRRSTAGRAPASSSRSAP